MINFGEINMELTALYPEHIETLKSGYAKALSAVNEKGYHLEGVLIHSGTDIYYFADDQHVAFHSVPHFAHWLPLEGPDHFLLVRPNQPLLLVRYVPQDFWHETPIDSADHWQSAFEIVTVDGLASARKALPDLTNYAYIGSNRELAQSWGIADTNIQPPPLIARLDYLRSYKTSYEIACLRHAAALGARGHRAAKEAFLAGRCEREINRDYLDAIGIVENETPYGNIVALNEKAAILHYQQKRGLEVSNGKLLLIDAGARYFGYCSDITRTYLRDGEDAVFASLLEGMEKLQRNLVAQATVGRSYIDIHRNNHKGVAELLAETGLIKLSAQEIFERGFTHPFFPHGVGHFLGIQVHDVAGRVADADGTPAPPPDEYPFLRNTRTIEAGQVFTIEPGFYFIPMLLAPFRNGDDRHHFDWATIDRLMPLGGIRIEDNIHVTVDGPEDLTRAFLN